jgi:hypothetical protein
MTNQSDGVKVLPADGVKMLPAPARLITSLLANITPLAIGTAVVVYAIIQDDTSGTIGPAETHIVDQIKEIGWYAALSGVLAMSALEISKRLFGLRGIYQRRQVAQWLATRTNPTIGKLALDELDQALGADIPSGSSRADVLSKQIDRLRLFNLPMEQVAAQVSEAAETQLMINPTTSNLLAALVGEPISTAPTDEPIDTIRAHRLQAGVDALQISVAERWRRYIRSSAVALSGLVGVLIAQNLNDRTLNGETTLVLGSLILGGVISWLARDLFALVERLRQGR